MAAASALFHKPVEAAYSSLRSSCTNPSYLRSSHSFSSVSSLRSRFFKNQNSKNFSNNCEFVAPIICGAVKPCSAPVEHFESEAVKLARKSFYEEVSFRRRDDSISLAKAALLICAEDEAFVSANRERDMLALQKEGRTVSFPSKVFPADSVHVEGQSIGFWLDKLDCLADKLETTTSSTSSERYLDILKLLHNFTKKSSLTTDPKNFYLHQVLNLSAGTAITLGIIYIEICRRLGLEVKGAPVGDDFLVWPFAETKINSEGASVESGLSAEMVFEPFKGGKVWSKNADGNYVCDSPASTHVGPYPTINLRPASNRTILSILLRNLKRLYWKRAAKAHAALDIAAPLHPLALAEQGSRLGNVKEQPLLRPQDLRLAVAASEKLLLLQPHDWLTRRDHGLLLYHSRRYGEAVQELSICMAVAPVHEVQILEPFVEKLHLLRVESSWAAAFSPNAPSARA